MSRKVAVLATVLFLFSTAARADIIDPIIGVRGGDASMPLSTALTGVIVPQEECPAELLDAICWGLENDLGFTVTDIRGFFSNPDCDPENPEDVDCILSLAGEDNEFPASDFPFLETFGDPGFGLQEFRFSGNSIPSSFPDIDLFFSVSSLGPNVFIYGFEFHPETTLRITGVNTIPEPGISLLLLAGLAAGLARRQSTRFHP